MRSVVDSCDVKSQQGLVGVSVWWHGNGMPFCTSSGHCELYQSVSVNRYVSISLFPLVGAASLWSPNDPPLSRIATDIAICFAGVTLDPLANVEVQYTVESTTRLPNSSKGTFCRFYFSHYFLLLHRTCEMNLFYFISTYRFLFEFCFVFFHYF